jgi:hypothetical protein
MFGTDALPFHIPMAPLCGYIADDMPVCFFWYLTNAPNCVKILTKSKEHKTIQLFKEDYQ